MRTAAYCRFSTDLQREASIDDQLRNIRTWCSRAGWSEPVVYLDQAISGSRQDRPGYLRLMAAAEAGEIDALLVDDLTRLSRDQLEAARAVRMLRHWGIRLIGVSDGIDTERKGHKIEVGLRGLMGELYLDDLAEKVHRGLMGQALKGFSAGGLPYGYRAADAGDGRTRVIDPAEAAIVVQIFEWFVSGWSTRDIAAELNRRGVPASRGGTWVLTAIYGDRRGIGILGNTIYAGKWVWNRSKWVKDPLSGRRRRQERPAGEWVITERPDLRIVPVELWEAAQARLSATRQKTSRAQAIHGKGARAGRGPKFLFSGLLACGSCGNTMVIVDRYRYGCSHFKARGSAACPNETMVPRLVVEKQLLASIKHELLSEDAFRAFESAARAELKAAQTEPNDCAQRLRAAQQERDNIMAAIRQGIITPSTKAALEAAEAAVEAIDGELEAFQRFQPAQMLPRAREIWRGMVEQLEQVEDVRGARECLRAILGEPIRVVTEADGVYAEVRGGIGDACQIKVVAGARYMANLTSIIRVPLTARGANYREGLPK